MLAVQPEAPSNNKTWRLSYCLTLAVFALILKICRRVGKILLLRGAFLESHKRLLIFTKSRLF